MDTPTKHQAQAVSEHYGCWWVRCEACGDFAYPQYDASDARGIARRHTAWWQEHGDA